MKTVIKELIYVVPTAASRPRVTRFGTYYGKTYKAFRKECAGIWGTDREPFGGPLILSINLVCKRPKKPTREYPRGDLDNYAKAVMDALTEAKFWVDDDQVVGMSVTKEYAKEGERPRIEIVGAEVSQ